MKVKAQVSQSGHVSWWSPEVKPTIFKPATCDYLRAGDFWSAMIATLYLSGQFPDLSLTNFIKRSWNWRVKYSFRSVRQGPERSGRTNLILLKNHLIWTKFLKSSKYPNPVVSDLNPKFLSWTEPDIDRRINRTPAPDIWTGHFTIKWKKSCKDSFCNQQ